MEDVKEYRTFKEEEPKGSMIDRMMKSVSELLKQMELELNANCK